MDAWQKASVWERLHELLLALQVRLSGRGRSPVCYDRRHEIHEAFLALGCCLVCYRRLRNT